MATITQFEDLKIGQESRILVNEVYHATERLKDFYFKNQMRRAALSVMNNIAKGFERGSDKYFVRFLFISKASAGEGRSMTYIAEDRNSFADEEAG